MKKYVVDFLVGLAFGLLFFFGVPLLFDKNPLFLDFQYYLLPIFLFLVFAATPYFRNRLRENAKKNILTAKSFFVFLLGFFLPTLTWGSIVYRAASNWTLF